MPFTPWKCADCGAGGRIRHDKGATPELIGKWSSQEHAGKSPQCHQRAVRDRNVLAHLTPRDRHIIVTARIKRKLMADSLRIQRQADREAAAAVVDDADLRYQALSKTRREWLMGKATRKGYAFT